MFSFDLHNSIFLFTLAILDYLTIEFYTAHFSPFYHKYQYTYFRYLLIILNTLHVFIYFPFDIMLINKCIYLLLVSGGKIKKTLQHFIKYLITYYCIYLLACCIILLININIETNSSLYTYYMSLIATVSVYITFHLYVNYKQIKRLQLSFGRYIFFFTTYVNCIAIMLYYSRLYAKSTEYNLSYSYVLIFICGIIVFTLHNYRHIVSLMEKQNEQNMLLKKYELEEDYMKTIDSSLKTLSKVRHDFKNHLIILDGYATQNEIDKLQTYIHKVNDEIGATKIFDTSHKLISALLNTKNAVCEKANITLRVEHHIEHIVIDDFSIITILGNIIDNAITAASKTAHGIIDLSIIQLDSLVEITCKNNHCETIKEKDGKLLTTKKSECNFHGIGLGNVKTCVDNINGTMDIQYTDSEFEVKIELPNYVKTSEA